MSPIEKKYKAALERVYNTLCGNSFNHSSEVLSGRIDRALRVIDLTLNPSLAVKLKKTPDGYECGSFKIRREERWGSRDGREVAFHVEIEGKARVFKTLTQVRDAIREATKNETN